MSPHAVHPSNRLRAAARLADISVSLEDLGLVSASGVTMTRIAQCFCGSLRAEADGDPSAIVACNCLACQRRTGSVLGVGAYYDEQHVRVSGDSREYVRQGASGHPFRTFFCPACGTSLLWKTERAPGAIAIAVGTFADPQFPAPHRSVFEQSRHEWVDFGPAIHGFIRGRDSERSR